MVRHAHGIVPAPNLGCDPGRRCASSLTWVPRVLGLYTLTEVCMLHKDGCGSHRRRAPVLDSAGAGPATVAPAMFSCVANRRVCATAKGKSMPVATMEFLDQPMAAVEAILDRVQRAVDRGHLGILGLGLCVTLLRLSCTLDQMGRVVSTADEHTEDYRRLLREVARGHQRVADSMSRDLDQLANMRSSPAFRFIIVRLLDALVVKAEDVAETAALGASVEFANLVKEDLQGRSAAQTDG